MKLLTRTLRWLALAFLATTIAAWASGGWIVTPLVYGYRDEDADRARRHLESLGEIVVTSTVDGVELTGVYVASDPGAPVVLHLIESGVSLNMHWMDRPAFQTLASRGFASVAFDYRGVGFSEGEVAAGALLHDAEAMLAFATEKAGGDPSRVIVRGCSLGTIALTMLLEAGHRPGAIMGVAPVEARSIAPRYAKLFMWAPLVSLAEPYLRPVTERSTVESFASSGVPAFAQISPKDQLMHAQEYRRWLDVGSGDASSCAVWERTHLGQSMEASVHPLQGHLNLALQSSKFAEREFEFLARALPSYCAADVRMEALLARADPKLAAEVALDTPAYARVRSLADVCPDAPANAALVAAQQLTDEEFGAAHDWIRGSWVQRYSVLPEDRAHPWFVGSLSPPGPDHLRIEHLRQVFDLSTASGRLPIADLLRIRHEIYWPAPGSASHVWSRWNLMGLETLRAAMLGELDHPNVWMEKDYLAIPIPQRDPTPGQDHVVIGLRSDDGQWLHLRSQGDDGVESTLLSLHDIAMALGVSPVVPMDEAQVDLIIRYLRQAAWIVD